MPFSGHIQRKVPAVTLQRRERISDAFTLQGMRTEWYGTTKVETPYAPQDHYARQVTFSEGHAWPRDLGTGRDVGGPFETIRVKYNLNWNPRKSFLISSSWAREYEGTVFFRNPQHWPTLDGLSDDALRSFVPSLSDSSLNARGSTAISLTAPTNPVMDATVSLAELYREGIPAMLGAGLLKNRAGRAKGAAGDYLGYQFGWLPLISDIRSACTAISESEQILSQLERDSGKNVRRRYTFPLHRESTSDRHSQAPNPTLNSTYWSARQTNVVDHYEREVWFSGCYTYHLDPNRSEVKRIADQARHLLGLKLTPDVLWNLAPWSWLSDWVVNIGPVMANVGLFANDGLTLRYGYTMECARRKHFERVEGIQSPISTVPPSLLGNYEVVRKRRVRATPFSMGLIAEGFNARQWSILTALGISRAPGRF